MGLTPRGRSLQFTLTLGLSLTTAHAPLFAQPAGGQVMAGAATFAHAPGAFTVTQTSSRAIIHWQDFSIAAGESMKFVQPDAASAALNRVVSNLPSRLAGALEANGQVFLVNPNGILVGAGARIDVGGFLASTLDVTNNAFLAGADLAFRGESSAAIVNLGAINALGGDVFLLARQVENAGAITAATGVVGLAAATEVLLTAGGPQRLFISASSAPGSVLNAGAITAASAELRASGGNAYALAINNSGLVRATGSAVRGGQIWLVGGGDSEVRSNGVLDASSASGQGGGVTLTAGRVSLGDAARLDASGATGGGEIFVGGGWRGADETIRNASAVIMARGAEIDVSARQSGSAGTAVLWSDNFTSFAGRIAATGGVAGGDGGKVETSSRDNLQVFGRVDASAPRGSAGLWSLDPRDVTIASAGASGTAFAATFTPTADSTILASSIVAALNGGSNVSIDTGTTGTSAGTINVDAPITWSSNTTLTLTARHNVRINANLTASGATAGLVLAPNTPAGSGGTYSINNRASITLSGATPSLTIGGQAYTVINSLGLEGHATTAPGTPTLQGLAAAGNLSGRYALGSNIDAAATSGWNSSAGFTPIGAPANPFNGTLDGLGHTISGLTMVRPTETNVGLFGYLGPQGLLRNIGVVDVSILGKASVGGLVGYNVGGIQRSFTTGSVSGPGGHFFTSDRVGGLVGTNANSIETSYSSATVSGTSNVGGLVGFNGENDPDGFNGFHITTTGSVRESYATGNVSGQTSVGGLAGASDAYFTVESVSSLNYVYATGTVTGTTNVGGLVGHNKDTGLLEGYATGAVTGTTNVGGLAGANEQTKPEQISMTLGIYSSYWDTAGTGQSAAVGLENGQTQFSFGRTPTEMKQLNSFAAFQNITNVGGGGTMWRIYEGNTTPWLTAFLFPVTVTAASDTKTYNGLAYSGGNGATYSLPTLNPTLSGTLSFTGNSQGAVNAGSYSLVPAGLFSVQQGYDVIYANGTLTVNKASLSLSGTRVYDGTTVFAGANLLATGVNGQTFSVTGAGAAGNLGSKDVQSNQPLATFAGLTLGTSSNGGLAANYNPVTAGVTPSSVSVTPAALTLSGSRVYNGLTSFAGTNLSAAGVNGETFTVTGAGDAANLASKNVQTNQLLASVAGLAIGTGNSGAALATNYGALSVTASSVSVTPANLTLSGTRTYDGTTIFAGTHLTATGVDGETFSVGGTGAAGNLGTKNVQTSQPLATVAGLTLGAGNSGAALASNYQALSTVGSTVSVTKASLTVSTSDVVKTYDGNTSALGSPIVTAGQLFGSDAVSSGPFGFLYAFVGKDVGIGNKTVTIAGAVVNDGNNGANYALTLAPNTTSTINRANLTLSGTQVYNGLTAFPGANLMAAGVNGESFTVTGAGAAGNLGDKNVQTAQPLASVAGLSVGVGNSGAAVATNYNALSTTGSAVSVTPATLRLTGTRVYDGTTIFAGEHLTAAGVNGETFAVTGAGAVSNLATKNVQTAQPLSSVAGLAVGTGNSGAALATNYQALTTVDSSVSVTPRPLTISGFAANDKVYDGTTTAVVATPGTLNGVVAGDTVGFTHTGATFDTKNVGTGKTVTLNGVALTGGGDQQNYTYTAVTTELSAITPATLTYVATPVGRLYGSTNPGFSGTVTGFVNGETLGTATTGTLAFTSTATPTNNVGNYAILGSGLAANNGNYVFVQAPANATALTITPAPLTITADNKSRTAGTANPPLTATYTGFVNGQTSAIVSGLSLTTTAGLASPIGSYPIVASGATAPNYSITFVDGLLAVGQNLLTISADNKAKIYGAALPTFTASYSGFVNGDTSSVVTGLQFNTTASASSNVGTYTITPFGATAPNYQLAYVPGTLTINPAALTITAANAARIYGASNPAFSATFAGLVNGDTSAVVTGLTFGTTANSASQVGAYPITPANGTAANYTITHGPGTLTIDPAPLTISADNKSKVYGAALPTFTASYSGLVNGDTASVVSGLTLTTSATAASGVGTSAIAAANATAANYAITHVPGTLTITPAPLTITADSKTRSVGVANPPLTATYSGFVNGDTASVVSGLSLATTAVIGSPAGSYPITPSGATAANYDLSFVNGTLTVGQNILTITADNKSKTYGAPLPTFTATYTGLLNGDTPSVVTGLQFNTTGSAAANIGTYTITPFGGTAPSYTLAYVPGVLTINPAALTIAAANASRAFGAANPPFTATYAGFVNGDTAAVVNGLSLGTPATPGSPAGNYPITPAGATAQNYTISFVPGTLTIDAAQLRLLTIAADNKAKLYGEPLPGFTATYSGLTGGDTPGIVTGLQFSTTASSSSNVGTYTITPSGATAPGYTLAYVPGTLTINPAALTIAANNATRTYGGANPLFDASITGLVNGDARSIVTGLSLSTSAVATSNVGSYPITPAGATAPNYTIAYVPGTLGITPAPLTITASNGTRAYGAANPTFTASMAGFVNGDTANIVSGLALTTPAIASSNVGTYPITPAGATAPNYTIAYVPGTLGVTPAPLTITANNATRTYGAANPAFTASFTGFLNGDNASVVTGLSLTTSATASSNVGSYSITPSGASALNYTLGYVPGTLSITPAPLTITAANASRIYGGANPPFSATFSGFVNGDTPAVAIGLTFTTPATSASGVGSYPITPGGATAPNYSLIYQPGTLTVNAAPLTITANNASRELGAPNPVFGAVFAGFVNGDGPSAVSGLAFSTPATFESTVGSYAIIPSGAMAANYAIAFVNGMLTVTPPATVVGGPGTPATSESPALGQLTLGLNEASSLTRFSNLTTLPDFVSLGSASAPNFGRFELVTTLGGDPGGGIGGGGGGTNLAGLNEPGLYREASLDQGGFKVIYHEPLSEAREQAKNNRALGSSYREFLDTEVPRVDVVRAGSEQTPGEEAGNSAAGRNQGTTP